MIARCCVEPSNTFLYINDSPKADGTFSAMLVDASCDVEALKNILAKKNANLDFIVLTHGHYDHVTSLEALKKAFPDALTICHRLENDTLTDIDANVSDLFEDPRTFPACEKTVDEGDEIVLKGADADVKFKVLHTPGHTPGCICLYNEPEKFIFTGDTIFADGGVGRTDFKGGSMKILNESLERLSHLGDDVTILPGHGRPSTIGDELYFF